MSDSISSIVNVPAAGLIKPLRKPSRDGDREGDDPEPDRNRPEGVDDDANSPSAGSDAEKPLLDEYA